jgi:hypothetical protein
VNNTLPLLLIEFFTSSNSDLLATGSKPTVGSSKKFIFGFAKREIAVHNFLLLPPLRISAILVPLSKLSYFDIF